MKRISFLQGARGGEQVMVQKKRILLIEDEEDIAALIKLQAELAGFSLHVEVDGINGFEG